MATDEQQAALRQSLVDAGHYIAEPTRRVSAPRGRWALRPIPALIRIGTTDVSDYSSWKRFNVYADGVLIGRIESRMFTEMVKIKGTRLGRELAPRRVWSADCKGASRRLDTRYAAIRELFEANA